MHPLLRRFNRTHYTASIFLIFLSFLATSGWAQTPFFDSTISVGDTQRNGESYVVATATDTQGNSYVLGSFIGTIYFGSQRLTGYTYNLFLLTKFDAAGNFVWAINPQGNIRGGDLTLDASGNLYVTGTYTSAVQLGSYSLPDPLDGNNGDAFVAKLDAAGNWQWVAHGGGSGSDYGTALVVDATGNVTVVGSLGDSNANFGSLRLVGNLGVPNADKRNTFVGRLDSNGNWLRVTTGGSTTNFTRVAVDGEGDTYISGSYSSASLQLGSFTLANANPGNIVVYVAKLTSAGNWQWAVSTSGDNINSSGIAVDNAGTIYITGGFSGNTASFGTTTLTNQGNANTGDIYVAALNANGTWRWATQAGGPDYEVSGDLTLDKAGRPVITGEFGGSTARFGTVELVNSSTPGKSDAFVAKLDTTGAWYWALSTTGSEDETGQAIAMAPDGAASIVGSYWGTPTIGSTILAGNILFPNVFLTKVYDDRAIATITTVAPSTGAPGQVITLTGTSFVGVKAVLFNSTPAAAFLVKSSSRLEATVPAGVTLGPISVCTTAGTTTSTTLFEPVVLATALPSELTGLLIWPNPVEATRRLRVRLPETLSLNGSTRAELRNSLGQVVWQGQFSGQAASLVIGNLTSGIYQLTLFPAGQATLMRRIEVVD
jgi:hypothetical protein